MEQYLKRIYVDPKNPAAFSGPQRLYREVEKKYPGVSMKQITDFLKSQPSYSLHAPSRKKFRRSRVITGGLDESADLDLADMSNIASQNNRFNYLIILIDKFSRYAQVEPIRNKTAQAVTDGLRRIFSRGRVPRSIRHDAGKEFLNKQFRDLMKLYNIRTFTSRSTQKANYAERFIRTLKSKIYRYMTENNTKKYVDILQDLITSYNNSYHSSIKMNPADVNEENESDLWKELYLQPIRHSGKHKLKENQRVRVAINKNPFQKGYTPNWSEAVYKITRRIYRGGIPVYKLEDLEGEPLPESYYEQQLQPIKVDESSTKIKRVILKRQRRGQPEYYVEWRNYGPRYNR